MFAGDDPTVATAARKDNGRRRTKALVTPEEQRAKNAQRKAENRARHQADLSPEELEARRLHDNAIRRESRKRCKDRDSALRGISVSQEAAPEEEVPARFISKSIANSSLLYTPMVSMNAEAFDPRSLPKTLLKDEPFEPRNPEDFPHIFLRGNRRCLETSPYLKTGKGTIENPIPIVTWSNGYKTQIPYIPGNKGQNRLFLDQKMVEKISAFPAAPDNEGKSLKRIVVIEPEARAMFHSLEAFIIHVNSLVSDGLLVVSRKHFSPEEHGIPFDAQFIHEKLGLHTDWQMEAWDAETRVENFSKPTYRSDLTEFLRNLGHPWKLHAVMDTPGTHLGPLPGLANLNQGETNGWGATSRSHSVHPKSDRDGVTAFSRWVLLHYALFLTYCHHDANGLATAILMHSGVKAWSAIWPSREGIGMPRQDWMELMKTLLGDEYVRDESGQICYGKDGKPLLEDETFLTHADGETYFAEPGDVMFQPPNLFHVVFTVLPSITSGIHYLLNDAMHQTELARALDHTMATSATNQEHPSAWLTIRRMMIALPHLGADSVFFRRPLLAHCLMVLYPGDYVSSDANASDTTEDEKAIEAREQKESVNVAVVVLDILGIQPSAKADVKAGRTAQAIESELYQADVDWRSKGTEVIGLVRHLRERLWNSKTSSGSKRKSNSLSSSTGEQADAQPKRRSSRLKSAT